MKLLKKVYDKFKKPIEWIEIKIPEPITRMTKKFKGNKEEEE
jgi:hypothetical protein